MNNTQRLSIEVNEDHPAYQWARRQSDSVAAFGHIGTHIDCYSKGPHKSEYQVETVVIDCRVAMPTMAMVKGLDMGGKGVVLYTGNLERHDYGTPAYGKCATHLTSEVLDHILGQGAAFILIDSYGIGAHGEEHISFDRRCEDHDCFVIENIRMTEAIAGQMKGVSIRFDRAGGVTGKPCEVTALLG